MQGNDYKDIVVSIQVLNGPKKQPQNKQADNNHKNMTQQSVIGGPAQLSCCSR